MSHALDCSAAANSTSAHLQGSDASKHHHQQQQLQSASCVCFTNSKYIPDAAPGAVCAVTQGTDECADLLCNMDDYVNDAMPEAQVMH